MSRFEEKGDSEAQENNMKTELKNHIESILKDMGIESPKVILDVPTHFNLGDSTTNVAMMYAKELEKKPLDLALEIKESIVAKQIRHISRIDVIAPGFINFFFDEHYFHANLEEVLIQKENFGKNDALSGKKVLVEHSSPNLFKAFHIGHVMNNAIGESITRLSKFSGGDVTVISYPSDVSLGIAKAVWALMEEQGLEKVKTMPTAEAVAYLGACYVTGTKAYEDNPELQTRIREIATHIYEKTNSPEYKTYEEGKELNLAYFKAITETLGSQFDNFIYESETGVEGKKLVEENIGNVFTQSEGAVIYEGERDGLHTRVFINKEGYPTYEAKDLGLLSIKFSTYNPDLSIFVTDYEQTEYFKVVSAAASKINPIWKERTIHRTHGRMSFKGAKMSSRLGGIPSAEELLQFLYTELNLRAPNLAMETNGESNRAIAVAALKFCILRSMAGKNIDFDPDTSLSFEGDSGPYLQYSVVRANSILNKVESKVSSDLPENWNTTNLERVLERFPEVVAKAAGEYAPHYVVTYLLELASEFNSFYATGKILNDEDPTSPYRISLTRAFSQVMNSGLYLLGIQVPGKM